MADTKNIIMRQILAILLFALSVMLYSQESNFVEANGAKIHYVTYGEGEPILLLHNFTASHKMWIPWLKGFPQNYQYIIPDLRAHGLTSNPSEVFRHKESAMDMYELMDALGVKTFKALGTSSGSMTLIHMATMDTKRIESMILIGTTTYFPEACRSIGQNAYFDSIHSGWRNEIIYHQSGGEEQAKDLLRLFRELNTTYDDMNFTAPYLSTIACPTLIIHGDRDRFFPIDIPVDAYKSIPNAYLWVIPNGSHLPFVHSKTDSIWSEVFIQVLEQFFKEKKFY